MELLNLLTIAGALCLFIVVVFFGWFVCAYLAIVIIDWIHFCFAITIGPNRKIYRSVYEILTGSKESGDALDRIISAVSLQSAYHLFTQNESGYKRKIAILILLGHDLSLLEWRQQDSILKKLPSAHAQDHEESQLYSRINAVREACQVLAKEKRT